MANKHHKPEEIVAKLRQVEVLVGQGMARMSPYGTNRTFAEPRLKVCLRADCRRSAPNVSFRAESRRFFRGR